MRPQVQPGTLYKTLSTPDLVILTKGSPLRVCCQAPTHPPTGSHPTLQLDQNLPSNWITTHPSTGSHPTLQLDQNPPSNWITTHPSTGSQPTPQLDQNPPSNWITTHPPTGSQPTLQLDHNPFCIATCSLRHAAIGKCMTPLPPNYSVKLWVVQNKSGSRGILEEDLI